MRKILTSQFLTLDGVMDSPEIWNSNYINDAEVVNEILSDFSASDLLLFGKTTYIFFSARWPSRAGVMADYFNSLPKYVSSTLSKAEWNNTSIIKSNAVEEVKKLKQQAGENILLFGNHQLVQTLMRNDLIDEYKLYIYPLILGKGKRMFEPGTLDQSLKLMNSKQYASGVIAATYQKIKP